jgi:hypothetical protein
MLAGLSTAMYTPLRRASYVIYGHQVVRAVWLVGVERGPVALVGYVGTLD